MSHDAAMRIEDLNFAAQLVVWAGRRWAGDRGGGRGGRRGGWAAVETEFCGPLGADTGLALADALDHLFGAVAAAATRPVTLGPIHCHRVWPDELALISAVACAQHGDMRLAATFFDGFLRPAGVRAALPLAEAVGELLRAAGYVIGPARRADPPMAAAAAVPSGATIH
jgi:hypothetical protein